MSEIEKIRQQVETQRLRGYDVTLYAAYVDHVDTENSAMLDPWDFADAFDTLLAEVTRGDKTVAIYTGGETDLALLELLGPNNVAEVSRWKNEAVPAAELALFRRFGDAEFELFGRRFVFNCEASSWFEAYFYEGDLQNRTEAKESEVVDSYMLPSPQELADLLDAWIQGCPGCDGSGTTDVGARCGVCNYGSEQHDNLDDEDD